MIEVTSVCGNWHQNEKGQWFFVVDSSGGSCCDIEENITFEELKQIMFEDFNIDSLTKSISLSYALQLLETSAPMNIRNDRQLKAFIKKLKEKSEKILLCIKVNDKFNQLPVENVESNTETTMVVNEDDNQHNVVFDNLDDQSNVNQSNVIGKDQEPIHSTGLSFSEAPNDRTSTAEKEKNGFPLHSAPDISPDILKSSSNCSRVTADDLYVKRCFKNKEELMSRMRNCALDLKFEFTSLYSDTTRVVLVCVDRKCRWRMYAKRLDPSGFFEISRFYQKHTCDTTFRNPNHRQATAKHLGSLICNEYSEKKKGLTPHQIIEFAKGQGVQIKYKKAWRAKEEAQNIIRGTPEDSYINIAKWLYMVKEKNPGTATFLEMNEEGKFKYLFLAFGASLRGFRLMRRVIAIDGTFLKSKFKGTLLAATAQDGDYHLYPLAFAIVDSENDDSWSWFFKCMRTIIADAPDLVFVSDRAPSIAKGLIDHYPFSHHGICTFHLQNNIKTRFKSQGMIQLVQAAADVYTFAEFQEVFLTIMESNQNLAKYLEEADFKKWARVYAPANRYNMMTTNIAESLNSMLNNPREYPIRSLLETIRITLTTWFCERREKAAKHQNSVTPNVVKKLNDMYDKAMTMDLHQVNADEFEVKNGVNKFVVNLVNKNCTCFVFNIDRLPCIHAIAAIKQTRLEVNDYVDYYHLTKTWADAYVESIHPIGDEKNWSFPDYVTQFVSGPPSTRVNRGRPAKKRRRGAGEFGAPGSKSQLHRCSRCNQVGHNKTTCEVAI